MNLKNYFRPKCLDQNIQIHSVNWYLILPTQQIDYHPSKTQSNFLENQHQHLKLYIMILFQILFHILPIRFFLAFEFYSFLRPNCQSNALENQHQHLCSGSCLKLDINPFRLPDSSFLQKKYIFALYKRLICPICPGDNLSDNTLLTIKIYDNIYFLNKKKTQQKSKHTLLNLYRQ